MPLAGGGRFSAVSLNIVSRKIVMVTCNLAGNEFLSTNLFGPSVLSSFVLVNIT